MRRIFSFDGLFILCIAIVFISMISIIISSLSKPHPSHEIEGRIVSVSFDDHISLVDAAGCDRLKEKECQKTEQHNRTVRLQLKNSAGLTNLTFEKLSALQFLTFQKHWLVGYCIHIDYDLPGTVDSYLKSCPDQ